MRGQELPVSTIVLIVLALIILVAAIFFIVLPIYNTPTNNTPSTNMSSFEFNCQTYCGQPTNNNNAPSSTEFCTKTLNYQGATYHCYDTYDGNTNPIATCAYLADNGTYFSHVDQVCCGGGSCS